MYICFMRKDLSKCFKSIFLEQETVLSRSLSLLFFFHLFLTDSSSVMNELNFESFLQDRMARSDNPNDYVVVDPLLEKGKEKFNRMMAKQKRREREWAGKSLT